jgi:hypothetical protein
MMPCNIVNSNSNKQMHKKCIGMVKWAIQIEKCIGMVKWAIQIETKQY